MDIGNWTHVLLSLTVMHIFTSLFGYTYVSSEVPRVANEKLLNNLDQGVFIMDQNDGSVLFLNRAAQTLNTKLKSNCSQSILGKDDQF